MEFLFSNILKVGIYFSDRGIRWYMKFKGLNMMILFCLFIGMYNKLVVE